MGVLKAIPWLQDLSGSTKTINSTDGVRKVCVKARGGTITITSATDKKVAGLASGAITLLDGESMTFDGTVPVPDHNGAVTYFVHGLTIDPGLNNAIIVAQL